MRLDSGAFRLQNLILGQAARANELLGPIHDRMPAILTPEMEAFWLDGEVRDPAVLAQALVPYPAELMRAYQVSSRVNRAGNDGPDLIVPVSPLLG